ncbi:MAG: SEC-C domain-containing protein [Clostridia bacterium]|jgi:preprotein translocase subunit SecA|nr:SEC-C domain-containing protein [Clostridia bacterium]
MLDLEKEILKGVYNDIVNDRIKHNKNEIKHTETQHEKDITAIKKDYKQKNNAKLERNALCPCGSGKKFKNCCGE